jgi:hypothetical protein
VASPIEDVIFSQLAQAGENKSIDPAAVAKAIDPEGWRRLLGQVRATAVGLARQNRLMITRHGKPADPEIFKGVYRLKMPLDLPVQEPEAPVDMEDPAPVDAE